MVPRVVAVLVLALVYNVHAQIDERDTSSMAATMGLTGSITRGTINRTLVVGTADVVVRDSIFGARISASRTYGTFGAVTTERDVLTRAFGYVWTSHTLYPYAMMWVERSVRRSIASRWQPGLGITWVLMSAEQLWLRVSATASYDVVEFARALPDGRSSYADVRPIGRLAGRWRSQNDVFALAAEGWVQASTQDNGVRLYFDGSLTARLAQWLGLRIALTSIEEPRVPAGVSRFDLYASAGVAVNL